MTCGRFVGTGIKSNDVHKELCQMVSAPMLRSSNLSAKNQNNSTDTPRNQCGNTNGFKMSSTLKPTRYVRNCSIKAKTPIIATRLGNYNIESYSKPSFITFENNTKFRIPVDIQIHQTEEDSIPIDKKMNKENIVSVSFLKIKCFVWKRHIY